MHVYVEARSQPWVSFLRHYPPCWFFGFVFGDRVSHSPGACQVSKFGLVTWLASLRSSCLCLPRSGMTNVCHNVCLAVHMDSRDHTETLPLAWQALYLLSHFPVSSFLACSSFPLPLFLITSPTPFSQPILLVPECWNFKCEPLCPI